MGFLNDVSGCNDVMAVDALRLLYFNDKCSPLGRILRRAHKDCALPHRVRYLHEISMVPRDDPVLAPWNPVVTNGAWISSVDHLSGIAVD